MTSLEKLVVSIEADATKLHKELDGAISGIEGFAANAVKALAGIAAAAVGVAVAIGGIATKAFSDFDLQLTRSQSIMGDLTEGQMKAMRDAALKMSTETVHSAAELAHSFYYLASAGLTAEQSIAAMPQIAKFAAAGAFDLATATDLSTAAQTALGLRVADVTQNLENLARVTDVVARISKISQGTTQQFAMALTRDSAAAMKQANIQIEEGVAVLGAYAKAGIKGEMAGNMFGRMLRLLSSSAVKHAAVQKELGFSVFDTTTGAMRPMADIVENLEKMMGKLSAQGKVDLLDKLGFKTLQQKALLPLVGMSKQIREFEAELKKAGGTSETIARKQLGAFANQMTLVGHHIHAAAIEVGEMLAPAFLAAGKGVIHAVEWLRDNVTKRGGEIAEVAGMMWESLTRHAGLAADALVPVGKEFARLAGLVGAWARRNAAAILSIASMVAGVGLAVVGLKALSIVLTLTGVQQAISTALWAGWTLAVVAAKLATIAYTAVVTVLNIALGVTSFTLGTIVVEAAAVAAAFVLAGSAIMGVYTAGKSMWTVLLGLPTTYGPIAHISELFGEWKSILEDVARTARTDLPAAWKLLEAGTTLAVSQIKDLWPPLWEFIRAGFDALSRLASRSFAIGFDDALDQMTTKWREWSVLKPLKFIGGPISGFAAGDLLDSEASAEKAGRAARKALEKELKIASDDLKRAAGRFEVDESPETRAARGAFGKLREETELDRVNKEIADLEKYLETEAAPALAAVAKDMGAGIGEGLTAGLKGSIGKFDAVLFGSAEAISRLADFKSMLEGEGGLGYLGKTPHGKKGAGGAPVAKFDAADFGGAEAAGRKGKTEDLLADIRDGIRKLVDKPGADIDVADLA